MGRPSSAPLSGRSASDNSWLIDRATEIVSRTKGIRRWVRDDLVEKRLPQGEVRVAGQRQMQPVRRIDERRVILSGGEHTLFADYRLRYPIKRRFERFRSFGHTLATEAYPSRERDRPETEVWPTFSPIYVERGGKRTVLQAPRLSR